MPKSKIENGFSFSGIKTAVLNLYKKNPQINKADLCASFQKTVTEMLLDMTLKYANKLNINKIVLAGGVSANTYIRKMFENSFYPEIALCTDNAAMIGTARVL